MVSKCQKLSELKINTKVTFKCTVTVESHSNVKCQKRMVKYIYRFFIYLRDTSIRMKHLLEYLFPNLTTIKLSKTSH